MSRFRLHREHAGYAQTANLAPSEESGVTIIVGAEPFVQLVGTGMFALSHRKSYLLEYLRLKSSQRFSLQATVITTGSLRVS